MNTRFKHVSTAMVLAVVFNLTSASLQAQTRDSDVSASERVTQVSDSKVNAKPSISFAESVKKKVAAQSAVKSTTVAPSSAPKVVSQPAVKSAPVARTWGKQIKSADEDASFSINDKAINYTEAKLDKPSVAVEPTPVSIKPITKVVNSAPKVLEFQPDVSLSAEENALMKEKFNKTKPSTVVEVPAKAVEVVEPPKQKVEVALPVSAPMTLTQQQIQEMNKAEQAKMARKISEEKAAFENLPADKKLNQHKVVIEPLEKMQQQNSRQFANANTLALKNAYLDYLNTLKAEFAKSPNAEIAAEIEAVNNKISKL